LNRARQALPILAAGVLLCAAIPCALPGAATATQLDFLPQLGLPASDVNMIGAAPGEAPGSREAPFWASGSIGSVPASVNGAQIRETPVLLRHAEGSGWQVVPVVGAGGEALPFIGTPAVTYDGGLVLLGSEGVGKATVQTILTRDPGGSFVPAPGPAASGAGVVLEPGESLYPTGSQGSPLFTAIDEPAHTGALVVPGGLSTTDPGVLHYDGAQWAREPICTTYTRKSDGEVESCTVPAESKVLAIAASSSQNAWLLASSSTESLMLFKRTAPPSGSGPPVWVQSQPAHWVPSGDTVFARAHGEMLTVTGQGVWVDMTLTTSTVQNADLSLLLSATSPSTVLGTWCYPYPACGQGEPSWGSLGAQLPSEYRSFAWPSNGGPGELGTRIITGLEDGAMLRFEGTGNFEYAIGGGGAGSAEAAFASPTEGWISSVVNAGAASAQVERIATSAPPKLQSWPLPFRRPLMAIAPQPGTTPGDPNAQALAVGDQGQIARYVPGEGWTPEFLYNAAGEVQTPRLRGVAWPEANRAYAVGDGGAMWVWRSETGLWEPDPAAPLGLHANLTAIAFSPTDPAVGYAVGKQGTLLSYDKTWTQQVLPAGLEEADFTSVAFAGGEALVTYRMVDATGVEIGGLLVNEGSGWRVETGVQALLAGLPNASASVLSKVAGLPDGGAVAAGPGVVIERDSGESPWQFSPEPLPEAQDIAALAAIEEGSQVRALASIDLAGVSNPNSETNFIRAIDNPPGASAGEPPVLIGPDPLPVSGYLVRQTAGGWEDLEQRAYPFVPSDVDSDLPNWPDAVLALDVGPSGAGWAVGGQTGGLVEQSPLQGAQLVSQSASALRLPVGSGPEPPQNEGTPISTPAGEATFAVGGDAQCAGPCADFADEELGPDAWLSGAVSRAARISGLHGFLYTGARVAEGARQSLSAEAFTRELVAYRRDLEGAGQLPVYAAASPSDIDPAGSLESFSATLGPDAPAGAHLPGTAAPPAGSAAYAVESPGAGGTVCVIVLDYSVAMLPAGELGWLAEQLQVAKANGKPAIVMGNADIVDAEAPSYPLDAVEVQRTLLVGGASAYLFESPDENRKEQIGSGENAIPALGSGTLGYVPSPPNPEEFLGASGFLLVSVDAAQRNPSTNRAPVAAALVPNISQLALDATDGTLLRRSQVALFQGLARRAAGGLELTGGANATGTAPNPYVPIPETCVGSRCTQFLAPSYTFSSSHRDFGAFVEHEPSNPNPRAVLQNAKGEPIPDEPRNAKGELTADGRFEENKRGEPINERGEVVSPEQAGLFCAYNAGTTNVSITTGGLTYSEPVTVQAGSVEQPCGTVPLINPPPAMSKTPALATPPPPPGPLPASTPVPLSVPPPSPAPLSAAPSPLPAPRPPVPPAPPFFFATPPQAPLVAALVPLSPVLARPIPPSGTAPVTVVSPAVAPEEKREDEEAIESARNSMAIYDPGDPHLSPAVPLALILLAAGAGAAIRRTGRSRRSRATPALARASWWSRQR
jgi:hypothetical protein